jgi:exonuclease-1
MLQRCAYILAANIKLVMVYDGDKLPCKEKTENKRSENREVQKNKAFEFLTNGIFFLWDTRLINPIGEHDKANRKFAESIDVTPLMAWRILKGIRQTYPQVECIVAPYEADAQLAYLSKIGYVDAVITEDSDLIPFGAACIIYKLDHNYECKQI